jgi:hypothetical protein
LSFIVLLDHPKDFTTKVTKVTKSTKREIPGIARLFDFLL